MWGYKQRRKTKRKNVKSEIHAIIIHQGLSEGEVTQREERLRKTVFCYFSGAKPSPWVAKRPRLYRPWVLAPPDALKPNLWTYNFLEVSEHNLERSQTRGFCMDFLNYREGVWFSIRFSPFTETVPSNLLISSGDINFVTSTANFCLHMLGLLHKISKNFKNKLSFKYFSLLMLFDGKKLLIWCFLKISILLDFVTKLILKS